MSTFKIKPAALGVLAAAFAAGAVTLAWLASTAGADPPAGPYTLHFAQTAQGGASSSSGNYSMESTFKAAQSGARTQTQGVYRVENVLSVTRYASQGVAAVSPTGLSLSRTAATLPSGAQGFDIHRSVTGRPGSYQRINGAPLSGTMYEDGGFPVGDYFYIVYPSDAGGQPIQWTAPLEGESVAPPPSNR